MQFTVIMTDYLFYLSFYIDGAFWGYKILIYLWFLIYNDIVMGSI